MGREFFARRFWTWRFSTDIMFPARFCRQSLVVNRAFSNAFKGKSQTFHAQNTFIACRQRSFSSASETQSDKLAHFFVVLGVASFSAYVTYSLTSYVIQAYERDAKKPDDTSVLQTTGTSQYESPDASKIRSIADDITILFVLGGPGSGKGTNCERLVKDYDFVHLSAGDLLRAEQNRPNSPYGELIKYYIREGLIVPFQVTIALLHRAIVEHYPSHKRFLIDGFPRAMDQALEFDKDAQGKGILYFECPEEELLKRLINRGKTSGRADDNMDSIKKRFKTFQDASFPVIEYYGEKGLVKSISCLGSTDEVYMRTKTVVEKLLK